MSKDNRKYKYISIFIFPQNNSERRECIQGNNMAIIGRTGNQTMQLVEGRKCFHWGILLLEQKCTTCSRAPWFMTTYISSRNGGGFHPCIDETRSSELFLHPTITSYDMFLIHLMTFLDNFNTAEHTFNFQSVKILLKVLTQFKKCWSKHVQKWFVRCSLDIRS